MLDTVISYQIDVNNYEVWQIIKLRHILDNYKIYASIIVTHNILYGQIKSVGLIYCIRCCVYKRCNNCM